MNNNSRWPDVGAVNNDNLKSIFVSVSFTSNRGTDQLLETSIFHKSMPFHKSAFGKWSA